MNLSSFIENRRPRWSRLAFLLDSLEGKRRSNLTVNEAIELQQLHQQVSSDLNIVQTRTENAALLESLENLVSRSYSHLQPRVKSHPLRYLWQTIRHDFIATLRKEKKILLLVLFFAAVSSILGYIASATMPVETASTLMGGMFSQHLEQTPAQRVAADEERWSTGTVSSNMSWNEISTYMTSFYFTNNTRVSIMVIALGFTFGIGTFIVLTRNCALIGCISEMYISDGQGEFLVAWLLPHGSLEIPAILFAATAGLMIARALWQGRGFTQRIKAMRQDLLSILFGVAFLMFLAGIIEATISQIHEPALPYKFKIFFGLCLSVFLWGSILFATVIPYNKRHNVIDNDFIKNT